MSASADTMISAAPAMRGLLHRRARLIALASWLLLALAGLAAYGLFTGAGLWAAYHHQHPDVPRIRAAINVAFAVATLGLVVTLFATVAFETRLRTVAAATVLVFWAAALIGGPLAVAITPPGPQSYERFAGDRMFHVPWPYYPRGAESPDGREFFFELCLDSLAGSYDQSCHSPAELTVRASGNGLDPRFDTWDERVWQWRSGLQQVTPLGSQGPYMVSETPDGRYYRRSQTDGRMFTMIICRIGSCRKQSIIGGLVLDYPLPQPEGTTRTALPADFDFSRWDEVDRKLAELVKSWEAK